MNRCTTVDGSYYLRGDVEVARVLKPNAAGIWIENVNGHYVIGGIAGDVTDIHSIDAIAEDLRRAYGDRSRHFLNLTFINARRHELGLPYIAESDLPHTV